MRLRAAALDRSRISGQVPWLLLLLLLLAATAAGAQQAGETGPIRVGGEVEPPAKIFAPPPVYNELAKKAKVTGVVIVEVSIDEEGSVHNVELLKDLPMGLGKAAVDAVKRWRFEPATLNGRAVAVLHTLTFRFQPESRVFKVIVNAELSTESLSAREIDQVFMKKTSTWPSGLAISPVNLAVDHPTREAFSRGIHGKGAEPIERRWDRLIFSGSGVPPLRVDSEEEVVEFVRKNAGAVGYVAAAAQLPAGVKELAIN